MVDMVRYGEMQRIEVLLLHLCKRRGYRHDMTSSNARTSMNDMNMREKIEKYIETQHTSVTSIRIYQKSYRKLTSLTMSRVENG